MNLIDKIKEQKEKSKMNTSQILVLGFAFLIFLGGLILYLPISSASGETTSFSDAMFTATTSVCVTGLVTVTTATHWSLFGKCVILLLIQCGGIGVVAIATSFLLIMRKKISLRYRRVIQESYNVDQVSGMAVLVKRILAGIFITEGLGAIGYAFYFVPEYGLAEGIAQSIFTSVSCFCNAGIDVLGENSLAPYVTHPLINIVTMTLIVVSGLGFIVWWDVIDNIRLAFKGKLRRNRIWTRLRMHSKLVLTTTGILIISGAVLVFIGEYTNPETLGHLSLPGKVMASFFQSITTRTAGFFTVDQGALRTSSVLTCLILMIIGGSPMGTAGGMKTTTIAVLLLAVLTTMKGGKDIEYGHRKIKDTALRSAMVILEMELSIVCTMSFLLSLVQPDASLADILYEVVSAAATVGLSRGLTGSLCTAGKWIIIITMYLGRIGPLTLGTALMMRGDKYSSNIHLAEEDIMIG